MAEAPTVHVFENSPEQIAYRLLQHVVIIEQVANSGFGVHGTVQWDRKQFLDAYADCIKAVRPPRRRTDRAKRAAV